MLLDNATPFAAIGFGDLHREGMSMAVIAVRGSYELGTDGVLLPASAQSIVLNDIYEDASPHAPLVGVGDLIPYKPAADVTVLGHAYPPNGKPMRSWEVGVTVGAHQARLRVHGPRQWEPALSFLTPTWRIGDAAPTASVPVDYRLASGGHYVGDAKGCYEARNPIGPGVLRRDASRVGYPLRAPQLEAVDEPLSNPFTMPEPSGFGPVPPSWAWRERFLGTRDEAWQRGRCPQMPADLNYRFFQTAHPDLIVQRLHGGETVRLYGLVPGGGEIVFALLNRAVVAHHRWRDGRAVVVQLTLDGLHLDLRALQGPWLAHLTWRGWVARCPAYEGASLTAMPVHEVGELPISGEHGLEDMRSGI